MLAGELGLEPRLMESKSTLLPLEDSPMKLVVLLGYDPRSNDYQSFALPLSYRTMVGEDGIEPTHSKERVYSPPRLSNFAAHPNSVKVPLRFQVYLQPIYLVEDSGIEPLISACKADVFPLALIPRKWSRWQDSNLRPPAPKAGAIPDFATPR